MRVKWLHPYSKLETEGDVINISVIKEVEHFLLLEDDGHFRSVPAEECQVIKPNILDSESNAE